VVVPVVLVLAAELDQMVTFQLGQVIGEEVVFAVPDTGADILSIDVVWGKGQLWSSRQEVRSRQQHLGPEPERSLPSTARKLRR